MGKIKDWAMEAAQAAIDAEYSRQKQRTGPHTGLSPESRGVGRGKAKDPLLDEQWWESSDSENEWIEEHESKQ